MKINLLIDDPAGVRSGYVNVDTMAPTGSVDPIRGEVFDLDWLVDDGEAETIVALGLLDYVPHVRADEVARGWARKLAPGGTLAVSVVDIEEVGLALANGALSVERACDAIYGEQKRTWDFRKSGFSLRTVAAAFRGIGLEVLKQRIEHHHAVVVCRRPVSLED